MGENQNVVFWKSLFGREEKTKETKKRHAISHTLNRWRKTKKDFFSSECKKTILNGHQQKKKKKKKKNTDALKTGDKTEEEEEEDGRHPPRG